MYWNIKQEDNYSLYSPLNDVEADFISALSSIDLSANTIIDASKIAFTESVNLALSSCSAAHLESQK